MILVGRFLRLVPLLALVLVPMLPLPADAQQLPRNGVFSARFGWASTGKVYEVEKDHVFWVGDFTGTLFNSSGTGFMHEAAVSCPAADDIGPAGEMGHGYCTVTDKAGDKAFLVFKCTGKGAGTPCRGDFQWIGGTGKYTGITGHNTFYGTGIPSTNSGWAVWDGEWRLP